MVDKYIPDDLRDVSITDTDKNYFRVVATDLNVGTTYPFQFRWQYEDKTYSEWSATYNLLTSSDPTPAVPDLGPTDVVGGAGFIKITWNGKDNAGNFLTGIEGVDVYITGGTFGDGSVPTATFTAAGIKTITASAGIYIVQLRARSLYGTVSSYSISRTVTVTEVGEAIESPVAPTGFTARAILGGIEVSWDGTYSGGATWSGFNGINIYAGTSATATAGTYIKVGQMTANKTSNKVVVAIDGTYVKYGSVAYIHASSLNKATPPVESSISANVASATPSQVVNTDLINEVVTATKIATAAITEVKIDNNAITAAKIATGAITETKIASDAITAPKIAAGAIEAGKIAAGAITADKIAANAIEADKIAANAVTAGKILAGAVTTAKLDALAITSDKIAANAITAGKIETNAITADLINSGTLKATTYIRVGTKDLSTGVGGRIEISSALIEDGNFDIPAGFYIYNTAGTAVLSAPLGGGVSITGSLTATNISTSSGKFSVNASGILTAQDADLSGVIKATGGYIGGTTTGWAITSGQISNSSTYVDFVGNNQTLTTTLGSNAQITVTSTSNPNAVLNDVGFADTMMNVLNESARTTIGAGNIEITGRTAPSIFGTMPSQFMIWTSVGSSDINFKWQGGRSVAIRKTGTGTGGTFTITLNNTTGLSNGMFVAGKGIAVGTTINVTSGTTVSTNYPLIGSFANEDIAFSATEVSPSKIRWWNYISGNGQRTANLGPNRDLVSSSYRALVVDTDGRQYLGPIFFFSTTQTTTPGTGTGEDGDLYFSTA